MENTQEKIQEIKNLLEQVFNHPKVDLKIINKVEEAIMELEEVTL